MITDALTPFRAIGNVCGDVPVSYTLMYGEPVLMIATGRTFLLYRGKELSLLRGGPSFESEVASVAQTGRFRFVAEGPRVHAFSHHKRLWTLPHSPELSTTPAKLLLARDDVVFSYGSDHRIVVRHIRSGDVLSAFPIDASETVTCMELLEGYNNKLLVATSAGNLQLFNFRTGELLVKTTPPGPVSTSSLSSSKVLCIASSNYKNIVAVGMSCGALTVFNIATMDEICTLRHENVAVTSLVFRTDKDGFIVSGTSAGEIAVWDLENRCLDGVLTRSKQVASRLEAFETPHTEAVHSLLAFPKGAMIVSASGDNAIMQFRFDTVDGLGLLVRERRGHMGECTAVKFYNSDLLVTAGSDQALRTTHVFSDRASWELSQGKLGRRGRDRMVGREQLKLSPATVLDTSTSRNYQWGSLVSLHDSSALTCSWRMDTRALDTKLSGITTGMHVARCVRMSGCGNFAVVGYSSGNVSLLNLQNKSIRQLFRTPEEKIAHEKSVEAVEVAGGNTVIVSGGLDGKLMLWSLQTTKHLETFDIRRPVRHSCLHEPSNLFICAQDQSICVYPCAARVEGGEVPTSSSSTRLEPVRIFSGHNAAITALALTPDSLKHIVSASADSVIMISDLAAGVCVGLYRTASPVTSLSFHPDALFLATTHLGERGSFLWTNNLRYGFVPDVVENPLAKDVANLPLLHYPVARDERPDEEPSTDGKKDTTGSGATAGSNIVDLFDATTDVALLRKKADFEEKKLLNEIQCLGVQRSGLSRNVWYNVTVIDQLKEKNQPLLPPKKRDVPFFLPTTSELRPTFIVQQQQNNKSAASGDSAVSRFLKTIGSFTAVQQLILKDQHDDAMDLFKNGMSAQDIDLELRTLVDFSDEAEYIDEEKEQIRMCLLKLLQFLEHHVASGKNADLTQGLLTSVLKTHGPVMVQAGAEVTNALESLIRAQKSVRLNLQHLFGYPNCLLGTVTGAVV